MSQPAYERVYNVAEVARIFRLSASAVRDLIRSGDLPAIRLGRHYRVPKSIVDSIFAAPLRSNFSPEDLGFGMWRARKEISDGVSEVNRIRNRNRKSLQKTVEKLEKWRD